MDSHTPTAECASETLDSRPVHKPPRMPSHGAAGNPARWMRKSLSADVLTDDVCDEDASGSANCEAELNPATELTCSTLSFSLTPKGLAEVSQLQTALRGALEGSPGQSCDEFDLS